MIRSMRIAGTAGVPKYPKAHSELRRPYNFSALLDLVPQRPDALGQFSQPQL